VVRTRVGYAGGAKENPTYYSLGDHSETIQIDYDPSLITYQELLDVFWDSHSPLARPWSQQYASIIFYHDEEQRRLAEESMARQVEKYGRELFTEIVPYTEFYLAEDYHQKYRLQSMSGLAQAFRAIYPDEQDFVDSTAVARANGYAGGHGTLDALLAEIDALDLPPETKARLLDILTRP
jgi:peptide-methionine (S)-S-oxide reductase